MSAPPKYPRVPHIDATSAAGPDDGVLSEAERLAALAAEVVVEEKLDGMNVMLWIDEGKPRVGTRGGENTSDRSGERGRLRAWVGMHADALVSGLDARFVIYAEWLRRRHVIAYDQLPSELVGLDILDLRAGTFVTVDERDILLARLGLARPPTRFRGVLGSTRALHRTLGPSAFGGTRAEGVVVRTVDGRPPRIAKYVDPVWQDIGSAPWEGVNRLAAVAAGRD